MLQIIVDDKIPFIRGRLERCGQVVYLPAEDITNERLKDADALFIRTRTRCNRSLLEGTKVKFIATATIGFDHIDSDYCRNHKIFATNAAGCNAPAVAQYVFACLSKAMKITADSRATNELTIGVVGVGHVGKIVEKWARQLGMRVLLNDPPRADVEGRGDFVELSTIAEEADIVTFHTPLSTAGKYASFHLANNDFFNACKRGPIIINAARGPVVDTVALLDAIESRHVGATIIDCWENEPAISLDLLNAVTIATPHIAGYSLQGKIRATKMVVDAFNNYFNITPPISINRQATMSIPDVDSLELIAASYDPTVDMANLRNAPHDFERLRDFYLLRNELE